MDIEFKQNKGRRRLALVVGFVLAIAAGGAAFTMTAQPSATAEALPTRNVLIAAVDIPARTVIDASYLTLRDVPEDASTTYAITDPAEVLGLTTGLTIFAGQVITPNYFTTTSANQAFAIVRPGESLGPDSPHWRAVAIEVQDLNAVGGLLKPGQRVDLLASLFINVIDPEAAQEAGTLIDGGPVSGLSTKVVLTDLEILAHTDLEQVYVLKVDAHQGEEIAYLQNQNPYFRGFSLMLRADGDVRVLPRDGYGVTGDRILLKYGFPLEQAIMGDRYPQPSAEPVVLDPTPAPIASATPMAPPFADPSPLPSTVPASDAPPPSAAPEASPAASSAPVAGG